MSYYKGYILWINIPKGLFMEDTNNKSFKIRFKFITGEEFEAEGTPEFIESQRAVFLQLTKNQALSQEPISNQQSHTGRSATVLQPATQPKTPIFAGKRLWEQISTIGAGNLPVLRKKTHTTPQEGALILLAVAKELQNQEGGLNALSLSRALQHSGFTNTGRLDRLLAPLTEQGYLTSQGSKRSRKYILTPQGLTRAFVLATKKAGESL